MNVILFGASQRAQDYLASYQTNNVNILAIADNDPKKSGTKLAGHSVISPAQIKEYTFDEVVITSQYYMEIMRQLDDLGISNYRVASIQAPSGLKTWLQQLSLHLHTLCVFIVWVLARLFPSHSPKTLHIFPKGVFFDRFSEQIGSQNNDYLTWFTGDRPTERTTQGASQISITSPEIPLKLGVNFLKIVWKIARRDRVIIHGYRLFYSSFIPFLVNKVDIQWVTWGGGDLYSFGIDRGVWAERWNISKSKFSHAYCFTKIDERNIKALYDFSGKTHFVAYFNPLADKVADNGPLTRQAKIRNLTVMIGHAAFAFLAHRKLLETISLSNVKQVTLPLAYGSESYKKDVLSFVESHVEIKAVTQVQDGYMPPNKYVNELASVDVLLLNASNQVAVSTIYFALYMGITLYLTKNHSVLWSHLVEDNGFHCIALESLNKSPMLRCLDTEQLQENREKVRAFFQDDKVLHWWPQFR